VKANDDGDLEPTHVVAIGRRVRAERERRAMSVRELARRVGVSPSLISQIETGKAQPSVGTLYSLTRALRMSVDQLFAGEGDEAWPGETAEAADQVPGLIVRARERKVIDLDSGVRWERLTSTSHPDVDFLSVVYEVGGASSETMMRHAGREFGTVLSGVLTVTVNFDDHVLYPGDSIAFPSTTPHRLWNGGTVPVHAIWVVIGRHRVGGGPPS
jgi:transcriptional regulator with XRE-family HTH domain